MPPIQVTPSYREQHPNGITSRPNSQFKEHDNMDYLESGKNIAPITEVIDTREKIKLTKNSKGYNWDVTVFPLNDKKLEDEDLNRLEMLNNKMKAKYGGNQEKLGGE